MLVWAKLPWQRDLHIDCLKRGRSAFPFNTSEAVGVQTGSSSSAPDGHPFPSFLLSCRFCHSLECCFHLHGQSLLPRACSWSGTGEGEKTGGEPAFFLGMWVRSHTQPVCSHPTGQNKAHVGHPRMQGRQGNGISNEVPCIQLKLGSILVPKGRRVWVLGAYWSHSSPHRSLVLSHGPFSKSEHNFNSALNRDQKHLWIGKSSV